MFRKLIDFFRRPQIHWDADRYYAEHYPQIARPISDEEWAEFEREINAR